MAKPSPKSALLFAGQYQKLIVIVHFKMNINSAWHYVKLTLRNVSFWNTFCEGGRGSLGRRSSPALRLPTVVIKFGGLP